MRISERLRAPVLALHLLALAAALGGPLFFAAAVAPLSFRVLPTRDLAAALTSPVLTRLSWILEGSFALLLLTSWLLCRWWSAPRTATTLLTRAPILGIIGAAVVEKLLIPLIDKIRADAPGLIDNHPAADPGRILLSRYHRLATGLFAVEVAAALLVLVVTARLLAGGRAFPAPVAAARPPAPKLLDLSGV